MKPLDDNEWRMRVLDEGAAIANRRLEEIRPGVRLKFVEYYRRIELVMFLPNGDYHTIASSGDGIDMLPDEIADAIIQILEGGEWRFPWNPVW